MVHENCASNTNPNIPLVIEPNINVATIYLIHSSKVLDLIFILCNIKTMRIKNIEKKIHNKTY
jgi:hypothetical protein